MPKSQKILKKMYLLQNFENTIKNLISGKSQEKTKKDAVNFSHPNKMT